MNSRDLFDHPSVNSYSGPILFIDPEVARIKVKRFQAAMPRVAVNYAIKSNPHPSILRAVAVCNGSFDVASLVETQDVLTHTSIEATRLVYSNPIRPERYLVESSQLGVQWYVIDSLHELIKVTKTVKNPQVYIRLEVPNDQAAFPLAGKFGISLNDAPKLVDYCADHNVALRGVSFHVGSQTTNTQSWVTGIKLAKQLFHYMEYKGLHPDFLNLGGGFPAKYDRPLDVSIEQIGQAINDEIADLPEYFRIIAEPGRYVCAEACHLLAQVISTNVRDNLMWAYLDTGVFHGIIEASIGDFAYHTETVSEKPRVKYTLAGPTCDSLDVVSKNIYLPHNLTDGDFVVFQNAGAYSITYATNFNGFPAPKVVVLEE